MSGGTDRSEAIGGVAVLYGSPQPHDETSAMAAVTLRYRAPLMAYFQRRMVGPAEAEDLTQEVFLRLIQRIETGLIDLGAGYIFTIAANLLRDRDRRAKVRASAHHVDLQDIDEVDYQEELVDAMSAERIMVSRETLECVLTALETVGPRTRDIFVLFRLEGMLQREIARCFGISVSAVEKHIVKAMNHITQALVMHGAE